MLAISTIDAQWSLTGNAITTGNFLGTTNNQNLVFKANNMPAGLIDVASTGNTFFGYKSGGTLGPSNRGNVAIGLQAMGSNTGDANTAVGYQAMFVNTSGHLNNAFGSGSLFSNKTGAENSAFGTNSLFYNTTGSFNTASGNGALLSNTTASGNTATGYEALYSNTTGYENTATGYQTLHSATTAIFNTAVGYRTLYSATTGGDNTAVGEGALYYNTSGFSNTANGVEPLYNNTTGWGNTAIGSLAVSTNTTGAYNTGCGFEALLSGSTGNYNTAHGTFALFTNISGSSNTALGYEADVNNTGYSNTTVVGNGATGTSSNQVRIGNSSVTSIGGYANWTNISDGRVKKNIKYNVPGLSFIKKLEPITYNLDLTAMDNMLQKTPIKDSKGNVIPATQEDIDGKKLKEKVVYTGFIAQDVEKAAKSLNYDFSGVDSAKNSKDLYGLRYSEFVVPLVKAVQELSAQNDSLKVINQELQTQLNDLSKRVEAIEAVTPSKTNNIAPTHSTTSNINVANSNIAGRLEQNSPNPFNSNTTIHYYVPSNTTNVKIIVTSLNGIVLKEIPVTSKGDGNVIINAGTLSSGNYIYSLIVNDKQIQSKQMTLTK